jgi:hypothetical protein
MNTFFRSQGKMTEKTANIWTEGDGLLLALIGVSICGHFGERSLGESPCDAAFGGRECRSHSLLPVTVSDVAASEGVTATCRGLNRTFCHDYVQAPSSRRKPH